MGGIGYDDCDCLDYQYCEICVGEPIHHRIIEKSRKQIILEAFDVARSRDPGNAFIESVYSHYEKFGDITEKQLQALGNVKEKHKPISWIDDHIYDYDDDYFDADFVFGGEL